MNNSQLIEQEICFEQSKLNQVMNLQLDKMKMEAKCIFGNGEEHHFDLFKYPGPDKQKLVTAMRIIELKKQNPFYSNHLFDKDDIKREKFNKWKYPILWFLRMKIQITEDGIFYYKTFNNQYFLYKIIPHLPVTPTN